MTFKNVKKKDFCDNKKLNGKFFKQTKIYMKEL